MKVAIVEDEKRLAQALKQGFELEGHTADYFLNASSAKEKLEFSNLYDLIVLDLMLPDADGAEVCTDLRATGVTTPILVLTARDSTEDKIDLLDRGADDFLTKPFKLGELIARGRALGRRPLLDTPAELSIAGVVVASGQRKVTREGRRVNVTERDSASSSI